MINANPRRSFIACALMVGATCTTQAQSVYIPDEGLRIVFDSIVPGCMDMGFLDTQHQGIDSVEVLSVYVTWGGIVDLTGIEHFTSAAIVEVITYAPDIISVSIPAFPILARSIHIVDNDWDFSVLTVLDWPDSLQLLSIDGWHGPLDLPGVLPNTLSSLMIYNSGVEAIPILPEAMESLGLSELPNLAVLPDLPAQLGQLTLYWLPLITEVPVLSNGLFITRIQELPLLGSLPPFPTDMSGELRVGLDMGEVPDFPNTISSLTVDCPCGNMLQLEHWPSMLRDLSLKGFVNLQSLPAFPNELTHLQVGGCSSLSVLPTLPDSLIQLVCSSNPQLVDLPQFNDSLKFLYLSYCPQINCLPRLPEEILEIGLGGQPSVTCLPNHPDGLYMEPENIPLCTVLNSTCPDLNPAITGTIYYDVNANGIQDLGESGWSSATVSIEPGGMLLGVDSTGYYEVGVSIGSYTINALSNTNYQSGTIPNIHVAELLTASDVDSLNDLGLLLEPNVEDLTLDLSPVSPFVPGTGTQFVITCRNVGTIPLAGTVALQFLAPLQWLYSTPDPTTVSSDSLTWTLFDMQPGTTRIINAWLVTDSLASLGYPVFSEASISPLIADASPSNNVSLITDSVVAAYDPNDKRVVPFSLTPDQVLSGEELEYTIRFQNTGTHQAGRVLITDTLSNDLQWNTMRFLSSSHPCSWVLLDNGVLRFTFEPIFLPDSTSDEPNSHGFVKFAMMPSASLMLGESLSNIANIYFDYNEQVITNEAVFTVDETSSVTELGQSNLRIWPNPVSDVLKITGDLRNANSLQVLDIAGRIVISANAKTVNDGIDVHALSSGTYTLRVTGAERNCALPFVKQ